MHKPDVIQRHLPESTPEKSCVNVQVERLITEVKLEPGDPFENLLRALAAITDLAYAGPEMAAKKMDRAFEKNLVALREKLDAEFTSGAERVRKGNLAGGAEIIDAATTLRQVVEYLRQYNQQLVASRNGLEETADLLTGRFLRGLEEKLLPSLESFGKTVKETGGKVAAEYHEMSEISRRKVSGVRLWSRLTYGWMFVGAVLLWLACSLISYYRLDVSYVRAYEERLAEMQETLVGNNAALKALAAAKVKLLVEEKRDLNEKPTPGRYILAVPNAVEVYKSSGGFGVVVFQDQK